jgi:coenzyme F420 hydrogenase subunit beta
VLYRCGSAPVSNFTSPTLKRVVDGQLCVGCGLCAAAAPAAVTMQRDGKLGYLRPVETACVSPAAEAVISSACPGATVAPWQPAPATSALWGPYQSIHTGHSTDAQVRYAGSSGGVLSGLLIHLFNTGAIDRVVHVAMDPDAPLLTHVVRSIGRDDVVRAAGSRYAPVAPLAAIAAELDAGGRFAFVGKPCDVSALRQWARHDPRIDAQVVVMLSFFCAGTPSQAGTDRIIKRLGANTGKLASFRYRGDGWPGYATAVEADGRTTRMSYAASWGEILSREVQYRCKICPDAVGGVADIAAADAWYGDDSGYPTFEEADGRSLIMARSPRGAALLAAAEAAGAIATTPLDVGEIIKMQPHQARRKRLVASRIAALTATFQPRPRTDGTGVETAAKLAPFAEQLRSFAGSVRRILADKR